MDEFIYKVKLQQIETMASLEELKEFAIEFSSTLNNKGDKQVYFDYTPALDVTRDIKSLIGSVWINDLIRKIYYKVLNNYGLEEAKCILNIPFIDINTEQTIKNIKVFYGQI